MRNFVYNYYHNGSNYSEIKKFFKFYYGIDIDVAQYKQITGKRWYKDTSKEQRRESQLKYFQDLYAEQISQISKQVTSDTTGEDLFARYTYLKALYENSPDNDFYRMEFQKAIQNFTLFAEEKMSEIRKFKLNKDNTTGQTIEDKLSYLFIENVAGKDELGSKVKLHLLDAKKILTNELSSKNYYLQKGSSTNRSSYNLNTSTKFNYNDPDLRLEYEGNEDLYKKIENLATRLNTDQGQTIIDQIANLSYISSKGEDTSVGQARAYDILLGGKNIAKILEGNLEQVGFDILKTVKSKDELKNMNFFNQSLIDDFTDISSEKRILNLRKMIGEHTPGLLQGDAQLMTNTENGQVSNELQIKTQGFKSNTIGLASTAMFENWYYLFTNPDILTEVLVGQTPKNFNDAVVYENFMITTLNNNDKLYDEYCSAKEFEIEEYLASAFDTYQKAMGKSVESDYVEVQL